MSNSFVYQAIQGPIGFSGQSGFSGISGWSGASGTPAVGVTYYYTNSASDVANYYYMSSAPDFDPETYFSV